MPTNSTASPRPLPDRPSLRHLKMQARDLLHAGLAASVTDAQFQIARRYGFASWPRLKAHVASVEEEGACTRRLTAGALVSEITTFLAGQDLLTLAEIKDALGRELEAAGPAALVQLHQKLIAGADWDFYPADPIAKRVHRVLADRLLEPGSALSGIEHVGAIAGRTAVIFANHLSYADANLLELLLQRSGGGGLADRLTAIAGPKVYSSRKRRFSSLCFGTIRTPQSRALSTDDVPMSPRDMARAARRSIEVAQERLRAGDVLLVFAEGTRSRTKEMQPVLGGVARYLENPEVWVLPVGIAGTDAMFPIGEDGLHRVRIDIRVGAPIHGRALRHSAGADRRLMMDAAAVAIAELLPAEYRGHYGGTAVDLSAARQVLAGARSPHG